jgi:hypothetical protein
MATKEQKAAYAKIYYAKNKAKILAASDAYNKLHPTRHKNNTLIAKYGITLDQYNEIVKSQNNKCKICDKELLTSIQTNLDHCHGSKKIRGILCSMCNKGLGHFKDNANVLEKAAKYIRDFYK